MFRVWNKSLQDSSFYHENLFEGFELVAIHGSTIPTCSGGCGLSLGSSRQCHIIDAATLHDGNGVQSFHHIHSLQYPSHNNVIFVQNAFSSSCSRINGKSKASFVSTAYRHDSRCIMRQGRGGFKVGWIARHKFSRDTPDINASIGVNAPHCTHIIGHSVILPLYTRFVDLLRFQSLFFQQTSGIGRFTGSRIACRRNQLLYNSHGLRFVFPKQTNHNPIHRRNTIFTVDIIIWNPLEFQIYFVGNFGIARRHS
mmetsp:Transcript_29675/g.54357  ORF Transcript_29675/g.54357 Transcript_29675/m.54357 type:complete len:254 (-) Transcript_29675:421-1182(-)